MMPRAAPLEKKKREPNVLWPKKLRRYIQIHNTHFLLLKANPIRTNRRENFFYSTSFRGIVHSPHVPGCNLHKNNKPRTTDTEPQSLQRMCTTSCPTCLSYSFEGHPKLVIVLYNDFGPILYRLIPVLDVKIMDWMLCLTPLLLSQNIIHVSAFLSSKTPFRFWTWLNS